MVDIRKEQVCILVKAYPQASTKYQETVCCAGITPGGRLRRLYPIVYRQLQPAQRFDRFDWIEVNMNRAPGDPRPESYRVDQGTLRLMRRGKEASSESKVRLWSSHVVPSLSWLYVQQERTGQSLGIVRPDRGTLRFRWSPVAQAHEVDKAIAKNAARQQSLFDEHPIKPLPPPEYLFRFEFASDGKRHAMTMHDWEVQATFASYKRKYGGADAALAKMQDYYGERLADLNPHLIVGNMQKRPNQFILIGVLRSSADAEAGMQQQTLLRKR
jgi:hypothetical protein